jgi:hypothetical protein
MADVVAVGKGDLGAHSHHGDEGYELLVDLVDERVRLIPRGVGSCPDRFGIHHRVEQRLRREIANLDFEVASGTRNGGSRSEKA